ncbi:MAG: NAD(P)/FAD-dependent oxidoreductase [Deltaproteobacteria bacterium]|nr:NAD(P)/FAD-dependent oxidoreductase [Deltaproteobacteria bacterium]
MESIVIVGAGFAGLCAAFHARALGADPLIIEAADGPGGAWRRMDPTMRCLSPRRYDQLPDGSTPPGTDDLASAEEVASALRTFADRQSFRARYGESVSSVTRIDGGFSLHVGGETVSCRHLVAATGIAGAPRTLDLPGGAGFAGDQLPAMGLHQRVDEVGQRVLVVGAGNSGADAVRLLAWTDREVTLSSRRALASQGPWPAGAAGALKWRLSGLPIGLLPPQLRCTDTVLPVDDLLNMAVSEGAVRLVGPALRFESHGVRCAPSPGAESSPEVIVPVDTVVLATGYDRDLDWLGSLVPRDVRGAPLHRGGLVSPHLALLGLDCQRTRRSGFLRGMNEDARAVVSTLLSHPRGAVRG